MGGVKLLCIRVEGLEVFLVPTLERGNQINCLIPTNHQETIMQHQITIDCPPEVLLGLHLNAEGFADYLKKQAAISLFKEGKLSSGTAAAWLGISRLAFLRMAFDAGATLLEDSTDDLARETALL